MSVENSLCRKSTTRIIDVCTSFRSQIKQQELNDVPGESERKRTNLGFR